MKLPHELEDEYVKDVLYNHSLENLPDEQWKPIEGFENYEISNYGRVKSLSRLSHVSLGKEHWVTEKIRKLLFTKQYNNYLKADVYNVHCGLSLDGRKYTRSVARLVYYHFVEKFDVEDRSFVISYKDNNVFNKHSSNLDKISVKEKRLTTFRKDRSRNLHVDYMKPVSQYTVEGEFIASFESIYEVEEKLGIACESIMDVINKTNLTSGTFRWFLRDNPPKKEDFYMVKTSDISNGLFNKYLWEKLGKPKIDKKNPPSCFNLSVKDILGEYWVPVPISGFESRFVISNKGRVKRLSRWISKGRVMFLQEKILSQKLIINSKKTYSLSCTLSNAGKYVRVVMSKLLYCCFVEEFDLSDRNLMVVNESDPLWDIDISKLSLHPANYVLKEKYRNYNRHGFHPRYKNKISKNDNMTENYIQYADGYQKDNIDEKDIVQAISDIQLMDDEHGAFWVSVMTDDENVIEVNKDLSLFVIFEKQQTQYQANDWNEVHELYKLLLMEKFDVITEKVK